MLLAANIKVKNKNYNYMKETKLNFINCNKNNNSIEIIFEIVFFLFRNMFSLSSVGIFFYYVSIKVNLTKKRKKKHAA
jgi:hypothetical protein